MALLIAPTNLGRPVRLLAFVLIVAVLGLLTWGRYDPRIGLGGFTRVRADILGFVDPLIGTLNGGGFSQMVILQANKRTQPDDRV